MPLCLFGPLGLGIPELFVLAVLFGIPVAVIFVIKNVARNSGAPNRYCTSCGRGLRQPPDAPFCSYCGVKLP